MSCQVGVGQSHLSVADVGNITFWRGCHVKVAGKILLVSDILRVL